MRSYDVVIVGAGVSGTSLLREIALNSNVKRIALIEKYGSVAQVNSHPANNAQTLHIGDIETNYDLAHARKVKASAEVLLAYVERRHTYGLYRKMQRMVLGVGSAEVLKLRARYEEFKADYPALRLINAEQLAKIEPNVMAGRDPLQEVCALVSEEGHAINYQILAKCFLEDALSANPEIKTFFNTSVIKIEKSGEQTILTTNKGKIMGRIVMFAAGAYSLHFAHQLGLAKNLMIHPINGDFWESAVRVDNKIYRVQNDDIPFSKCHFDPDVIDPSRSRFGPTTKWSPFYIRHSFPSMFDYLRSPVHTYRGISQSLKLFLQRKYFTYIMRNLSYDIPVIGKYLFLKNEAREIIPSLRYCDIKKLRGAGGTRPQIFNLMTGELEMGDKTLISQWCIFNTTPSPGATVCLANAQRDAAQVVRLLNEQMEVREVFRYNLPKSLRSLGLEKRIPKFVA